MSRIQNLSKSEAFSVGQRILLNVDTSGQSPTRLHSQLRELLQEETFATALVLGSVSAFPLAVPWQKKRSMAFP